MFPDEAPLQAPTAAVVYPEPPTRLSASLIAERLAAVNKHIDALATKPVTIVGATKSCTPQELTQVYDAGLRHFGENRVQSLLEKQAFWKQTALPEVAWHFIGTLQSNKVNKVVGQVALIHSVESLALAEAISQRALTLGIKQAILLQVNISHEAQKSGFQEQALKEAFPKLLALKGLNILGLMGMAASQQKEPSAANAHTSIIQRSFESLHLLKNTLEWEHKVLLQHLSIGMSQDYIHALPVGATILRLGQCLFS
jgi:PLP dependent protein